MRDLEFHVESLEQRRMMAGDVSVKVTGGGDLRVTGDSSDNQVVIRPMANTGQFLVQGLNGTTINGDAAVAVNGITDDFRINLRGGDNVLSLLAKEVTGFEREIQIPDDLSIRTGGGSDAIVAQVTAGGDINIRTGGGEDAVSLRHGAFELGTPTADRIMINTGSSGDILHVSGLEDIGSARMRTGSGTDALSLVGNHVNAEVEIVFGGGDDVTTLFNNTFEAGLIVRGGNGNDRFFTAEAPLATTFGSQGQPSLNSVEDVQSFSGSELLGIENEIRDQYTADDNLFFDGF